VTLQERIEANTRPAAVDLALERVLNAAGSSLRHYMPSTRDELRAVMKDILTRAMSDGAGP
jgi:hypothetical protein